jgi:hypothetical protein
MNQADFGIGPYRSRIEEPFQAVRKRLSAARVCVRQMTQDQLGP